MFWQVSFSVFFLIEQSDLLPKITEDMKIYKLSAGDGSVDPVMVRSKDIPLAWLSLLDMSQIYQIRNRQKRGQKQRVFSESERRLALYKLKVGRSQTTPATATQPFK